MSVRGIKVKVVDVNKSFVSFKYVSSNARSRVSKSSFLKDFQTGTFSVVNPEILEKD